MYINSTINALSKSDGNIAVGVFCHRDQRKFLRVFEDYQEMVTLIKRSFNIDNNYRLSLHTSSLDACKGERVEIDESAYPLMVMLLDDLEVTIQGMPGQLQQQDARTPAAIPPTATDSTSSSDGQCLRDVLEVPTPSRASSAQPPPSSAVTEEPEEYTPISAYDRDREIYDERIDADYEEEERAEEQMLHSDVAKEKKPDEDRPVPKPKFKPSSRVVSAASTPQVKGEKQPAPTRAPHDTARDRGPERPPKGLRKEASVTLEADARFEISITGPKPHQIAQFKTRGKHTVSKVLGAACRTFEIDYSRAKLLYVVDIAEGDKGEVEQAEIKCDPDETMAQAGVTGETQLFIRVEPPQFGDDLLSFD